MSYKFPIYRCDKCGVVFFDPPITSEEEGNRLADWHPEWRCTLLYGASPVAMLQNEFECGGTVKRFAWMDSDTFISCDGPAGPR